MSRPLPSTEDLERLAAEITPGPWKAGRHPWPTQTGCCPLPGRPYEISHEMRNLAAANTIANAEAIALLPALLREVLDRREAEEDARCLSPAQDAVPIEDELDEAWKSGFNAGFGEAMIAAHPPQPSVSVSEALLEIRQAVSDGDLSQGVRLDIVDKIALRALKGEV